MALSAALCDADRSAPTSRERKVGGGGGGGGRLEGEGEKDREIEALRQDKQ